MKTQTIRTKEAELSGSRELVKKVSVIAVYSFLIPRATLLGTLSPFALAFTASLPVKYAWLSFLGNSLGYFVLGYEKQNLLYMSAILIVTLLKTLFQKVKPGRYPALLALISGGAYLAVTFLANRIEPFERVDLFLRICEGFAAGGMTFLSCLAVTAFLRGGGFSRYQMTELVSCGILGLLFLVALMDYKILGFHPGIMFAALALCVILEKYGLPGGTVSGVCIACAISLYRTDYLSIAGVLVISALIAGIFSQVGRLIQTSVFLSVAMFGIFISGITIEMLFFMMDLLIGCGIYFMIPQRMFDWLGHPDVQKERDTAMKDNLENRLDFAARTVEELQTTLQELSQKGKGAEENSPAVVYQKTIGYVCKNCGLNLFCWDECYNDTVDSFTDMMKTVRRKGILTESDLEEKKPLNCCKKHLLLEKFNENYQNYLAAENSRKRVFEVQSLATEQLSGVSQMLWEVSNELSEIENQDTQAAAVIAGVFEELYAQPQHVFCSVNAYDRMEIDIYASSGVVFDEKELCEQVGHLLKRSFVIPSVVQVHNQVRISLYEEANFVVDFGAKQLPHRNGKGEIAKVCGDSYEYFHDKKGNVYLILSDGMGSGERAAHDSKTVCALAVKLLKSGFGMESALRFVNSSFQIQSEEEALVTLDIVKLDLYTGHGECYKVGGADSFVKTGQSVMKIESISLPAGIMRSVPFEKKVVSLNCGDFILLCSDGLLEIGEEKLYQFLQYAVRRKKEFSAQEWADGIANLFLREMGDKEHDDVSILVLKLDPGVE